MSAEQKRDLARGWRAVQAAIDADEVARIEKLSEEELEAELKADGLDAAQLPGADELVALGRERAKAGESAKGPARGWRKVEKLLDDDVEYAKEVARIEAMGDTELEAEARAEGLSPDDLPSAEELVARAKAKATPEGPQKTAATASATVVSIAPKRSARLAWIAAAAVAASGIGYGVVSQIPNIVGQGDTRADKLRDEAVAACDAKQWAACRAKLDEARTLDPEGEQQPRVKEARAKLEEPKPGP
jgi:hypothetical protein